MYLSILMFVIMVSLFYVLSPLFRKTDFLPDIIQENNSNSAALLEDYSNILASIKELEFDYNVGNISQDDFVIMNKRYRNEAIRYLEKFERAQSNTKFNNKSIEKVFCANCGSHIKNNGKFCSNCGEQVSLN